MNLMGDTSYLPRVHPERRLGLHEAIAELTAGVERCTNAANEFIATAARPDRYVVVDDAKGRPRVRSKP